MSILTPELRTLIESGPLAHLATVNADGSAQVSGIWIGLDGDDLVSGHMSRHLKVRNIERDPRVVLSFDAPRTPGEFLAPYAVLRAHGSVEHGDEAWPLLNRLAKVYVAPEAEFPSPRGPGYLVRYTIERVSGVGPWAVSG
ncbi:MAG TPA: PPOX class F420-dependent oxidoreductase [Pseudonocardia sp.]|jgi:PPOX class probable F420-dependent enzyme